MAEPGLTALTAYLVTSSCSALVVLLLLAAVASLVARARRAEVHLQGAQARRVAAERAHAAAEQARIAAEQGRVDAEASVATITAALDSAPDWIFRVDPAGTVVASNAPATDRFGAAPATCLGRTIDAVFPAHASAIASHVDRAVRTRRDQRLEFQVTWSEAASFVELRMFPQADGHLVLAVRDLTEQKGKEELLQRSRNRYVLAVQGANDGLWDWDLDAGEVYYSYAWKHQMGYEPDAAIARPEHWFDRIHPDDVDAVRAALAAHLTGDVPRFESEHRVRPRDPTPDDLAGDEGWSWVLARGMAVRDARGRALRIAGSLTDLTNRRVVAVTHEKASLLEHATRSVGIGIGVLLADRTLARPSAVLSDMAAAWADLDAWWRAVVQAAPWPATEPCPRCGRPQHRGTALAELRSPGGADPEDATRVFEVAFAGHAHEIGEDDAHVLLVKDVTESALARRRLQQLNLELTTARDQALAASRAKSAFLANMSHELRTPLNHILGYSEMIAEELQDRGATDLLEDVGRIGVSGRHLLELISGVLDLSKIEAGLAGLTLTTFPVAELVEAVAGAHALELARRNNRLILDLPHAIGEMTADRDQVARILGHLLSNAAKFTDGGQVTISLTTEARAGREWLVFAVADTGIGMSAEQIARLSEQFYLGDSSSTRRTGGAGIGLALVWRLTDMMGGSVAVESRVGAGATFRVTLPRLR